MKTWNDYKTHVKTIDDESCKSMEEIEELATVIDTVIKQLLNVKK